jgi:polyisoprenoid-binding protein YceI
MNDQSAPPAPDGLLTRSRRLDPSRSHVEFHVRHFYGLMTVKGRFARFHGELDASAQPAVTLVAEATSLDTGNRKRDTHLRSDDFFDADQHPEVRFESDSIEPVTGGYEVRGVLYAAGRQIPITAELTATATGDEYEIEASASVDHRQLGMTWSPLGILRSPSILIVRGRLTQGI